MTADKVLNTYEVEDDFLPLAFSDNASAQSNIVFAGYGICAPDLEYDDYEEIDVQDKIVLALRYGPEGDDPKSDYDKFTPARYKAMTAREKGAAALLLVTGPESYEEDELIPLKYDASFQSSGIVALSISRAVAEEILGLAGKELRDTQHTIDSTLTPNSFPVPGVSVRLRTDVRHERRETSNVVGYLEGNDPDLKDELIVIGAHYDHLGLGHHGSRAPDHIGEIHNGADDNASGVATVLELAEAFAAKRTQLKRSMLFCCFAAEEIGILGSGYYVNHPVFPLEKTATMINMDMVGRLTDNKLIVNGSGSAEEWEDLLTGYNETYGFDLSMKKSGYAPSDNTPFYAKGIPILFFFTGAHDDYHTPSDDVEQINAEGQERIVKYVHDIAVTIDTTMTRPTLAKVEGEKEPGEATGFRVALGTVPDFGAEVEGVKLQGVKEDGPAEQAGIRAGDIVVRVEDKEIKNLYDYAYALGEYKPGDVVDVEVVRDGETMTFTVTLAKRR